MLQLIQEQIDLLAQFLQRSVAIDDIDINLVATSRHFSSMDKVRMQALIERSIDQNLKDYLYSFGIKHTQEDIINIPAHEALGVIERSCYVVRWEGEIVGFLWLLGASDTETDAAAKATVATIAFPLYGMHLERNKSVHTVEDVVHDLIFADVQRVSQIAYALSKQHKLVLEQKFCVCCVTLCDTPQKKADKSFDLLKSRLQDVLLVNKHGEHNFTPLCTRLATELLIIIPATPNQSNRASLEEHITKLGLSSFRIGIGSAEDVYHLQNSYKQAASIAQILCVFKNLHNISTREELGIYANIVHMFMNKSGEVGNTLLTPKISLLSQYGEDLLLTIETFLDNAGNIGKTADELQIHRSSLYYRLSRIEEITSLSLKSGLDRLLLHLEIKLWHLYVAEHGGIKKSIS